MAGFDNDVVYGTNLDFSTAGALGGNATILTDGQMLIGTTALNVGGTHINVGTITSPNSSIVVGFSTPNITLQTNTSIIGAWTDEATSFSAASGNGYFCTAALTATLPASPSQGDVINIAVDTASAVVIQANTGQTIRLGNITSTTAGTATSSAIGDSLQLVYRSANSEWFSVSSTGNWLLA
jgi:hypothetical protein